MTVISQEKLGSLVQTTNHLYSLIPSIGLPPLEDPHCEDPPKETLGDPPQEPPPVEVMLRGVDGRSGIQFSGSTSSSSD